MDSSNHTTSHPLQAQQTTQSPATWQTVSYVLISAVVSFVGVGLAMYVVHKHTLLKLTSKHNSVKIIRNPVKLQPYSDKAFIDVIPTGNSQDYLAQQQKPKTAFAPIASWASRVDNLQNFQ